MLLVAATAAAGCGGGRPAVEVSTVTQPSVPERAPTTIAPSTDAPPAPDSTPAPSPPLTAPNPPSTVTTTAARRVDPPRTKPTGPPPAPVTTAATTSTTAAGTPTTGATTPTTSAPAPLPAPVLLDARQGFGTPCEPAGTRNPAGCFFFVYATTATRGSFHRIYGDASFATDPLGTTCGTQSAHHGGEDTCSWYLGPVYGRTAGQTECYWATTVSGGRESEPSNRVCLTWTDQTP